MAICGCLVPRESPAARELAELGYPVTIFDMYPAPGGMMVGGIPGMAPAP